MTSAFNLNVLARINRELAVRSICAPFGIALSTTKRRAGSRSTSRVLINQQVRIEKLDLEVEFAEGELIHTENSYKYDKAGIEQLAPQTGLNSRARGSTRRNAFSSNLLLASLNGHG